MVPGTVDLHLPRKIFFEKELSLVVSRAWGPGLFDDVYERKGLDYPAAYVPFTAQRNLEAVLELMRSGALQVEPMITHRFPLVEAVAAYERILEGRERFTGVLLTYPEAAAMGIELKDNKGARRSLEDLIKAYPGTEAAQAGKERLHALK